MRSRKLNFVVQDRPSQPELVRQGRDRPVCLPRPLIGDNRITFCLYIYSAMNSELLKLIIKVSSHLLQEVLFTKRTFPLKHHGSAYLLK
jgi:hypothetical protein